MSYLKLEIYTVSFELFAEAHQISFVLPKYELYELGSQLRRSADSVNSNIVEGYGRRMYKQDFLRFLRMSHSSCDETSNHIKKILRVYPDLQTEKFQELNQKYIALSIQIHNFIEYVKINWRT